jgi:hypothetical protein
MPKKKHRFMFSGRVQAAYIRDTGTNTLDSIVAAEILVFL